MAKTILEQSTEKPRKHHGIKCLDCKRLLFSKRELRNHKGHEVVYLNAEGAPDV